MGSYKNRIHNDICTVHWLTIIDTTHGRWQLILYDNHWCDQQHNQITANVDKALICHGDDSLDSDDGQLIGIFKCAAL